MEVKLIQHWGGDLMSCNSARVSMGKHKEVLDEQDIKLIKYLAKHEHYSPFEHSGFTFLLRVPIYVARQLVRHKSWSFNEISGRYVEFEPEFDIIKGFRLQSDKIKQGSVEDTENSINQLVASRAYDEALDTAYEAYSTLLRLGVAREQARAVLPLALMTELYATCNFRSFVHFLKQRLDPHAQQEIRKMAGQMLMAVWELPEQPYKHSLEAFNQGVVFEGEQ